MRGFTRQLRVRPLTAAARRGLMPRAAPLFFPLKPETWKAFSIDTDTIEITDAIIIFSWLFSGGAAPAEPSPLRTGYSADEGGGDLSKDGIGCDQPSPVCN
ncbi:MAG: hypothetical protein OSB83_12785 [Planctomycetota bacterium]|nr:hypothetical protein [Planctomycetota bacterium]